MTRLFSKYFELIFWVVALIALANMHPEHGSHFSFCIFKMLGFNFCPGCGIGHAISYLFHGNIQASFTAHPLGIFAIVIILLRIVKLIRTRFFSNQKNIFYAIR